VYRRSRVPPESGKEAHASERPHETLKLTDQYIALLVLVFTNAGLLDVGTLCVLHHVYQLMT
jgi:rapamycin-insensitive companion of mTOR